MNDKLKKVMLWSASVGAALTALVYLTAIIIMVIGIENTLSQEKQLLYSLIGAVAGMLIMYMLREQGISLAANELTSKEIMRKYYDALNKSKKVKQLKTINYYRIIWILLDVVSKGATVMLSTLGILYVFIEGNGDLGLILLATGNLLLFATFGIMGLSKAYDKYINEHLPVIKELTKKLDQMGSVPSERETNEVEQCEVSESTTTSGAEQEEHRISRNDVQPDIHNTASDTRSVITSDSKPN